MDNPLDTTQPENDPYFKARLTAELPGITLTLCTAALLDSAHRIDNGTILLLHTIFEHQPTPHTILEIGCNYGLIGLALARRYPSAHIILSDKDLLALRYTEFNCHINNITNATVTGSVGLETIPPQPFDLIVSDIPAKIGDRAIEFDFIIGAYERLAPNGNLWMVADSQLNRLIPHIGRRHKLPLTEIIRREGRIIYRIKKKQPPPYAPAEGNLSP